MTLVSNGFNPGGPLQTFVSNYGFGDGNMCQLDEENDWSMLGAWLMCLVVAWNAIWKLE